MKAMLGLEQRLLLLPLCGFGGSRYSADFTCRTLFYSLSLIVALPQLPVGSKQSNESQAGARRANHSAPSKQPRSMRCSVLPCHAKAKRCEGKVMRCDAMQLQCIYGCKLNANAREAMHGGRRALFATKKDKFRTE